MNTTDSGSYVTPDEPTRQRSGDPRDPREDGPDESPTCTWEYDDRSPCGRPATRTLVWFDVAEHRMLRWPRCRFHLNRSRSARAIEAGYLVETT